MISKVNLALQQITTDYPGFASRRRAEAALWRAAKAEGSAEASTDNTDVKTNSFRIRAIATLRSKPSLRSTSREIRGVTMKFPCIKLCYLLLIVIVFVAPPVIAAPPITRIDIKTRDIGGKDLTKEQCLQRIQSIGINKDLRGAKLDEVDISGAILVSADLSDASLKKSILRGANLSRANLTKTDLENAILEKTNLSSAKMPHANLKNANLKNANLKNAVMIGVNFSKALLTDADFSGADLTGAILEGAKTNGTVFSGAIMPDGQLHP